MVIYIMEYRGVTGKEPTCNAGILEFSRQDF